MPCVNSAEHLPNRAARAVNRCIGQGNLAEYVRLHIAIVYCSLWSLASSAGQHSWARFWHFYIGVAIPGSSKHSQPPDKHFSTADVHSRRYLGRALQRRPYYRSR